MTDHALVIGEALIDVVVRPDGTRSEYPGGSPANVALGLGRLGREVELLAWIGLDDYGAQIREHLAASHVTLARGSESAIYTSVAMATLDESGAAHYDFKLQWAVNPTASPNRRPAVVHTGSIAAVVAPGAADVRRMCEKYRGSATITYDPNVRPTLMGSPVTAGALIDQMVELADVVKVSDEDLEWLDENRSLAAHARRWLDMGPALVVVTRGGEGASAFTKDGRRVDVTAPHVNVADTVGAGDSFMGGLIDGLWSEGLLGAGTREGLENIESEALNFVVNRCVGIAAITVSRAGANPPTRDELGEEPLS